ncbi:MAG TPA: (d)CMP kinase [Pseudomonadaceae bacterium]|nr:(d)CMP kinase [Pseudomonadaceae bacterium]
MADSEHGIPVVTVDGPSGTGKGTLAQALAEALGWHFLDSGALYRVLACGASTTGIALDDEGALGRFARDMEVAFSKQFPGSITLGNEEISSRVRLEETGALASRVAAFPLVREALLGRQRAFRTAPGLVADGRDMGTVVFPDSPCKLFLTARPETRAERRYKQLINKGVDVNLRDLLLDIRARDERDSTRAVAPLVPAADAVIVDTDDLPAAAVYARAMQELQRRGLVPGAA